MDSHIWFVRFYPSWTWFEVQFCFLQRAKHVRFCDGKARYSFGHYKFWMEVNSVLKRWSFLFRSLLSALKWIRKQFISTPFLRSCKHTTLRIWLRVRMLVSCSQNEVHRFLLLIQVSPILYMNRYNYFLYILPNLFYRK